MEKLNLKKNQYKNQEAAIQDHQNNYRSSAFANGKFDKFRGSDLNRLDFIFNNVPRETIVLDIGCNDGYIGQQIIKKKQCTVFGVDLINDLIKMAQGRGIIAKVCNAEDLPFPENKFDIVIMCEVLEHLYDPYTGLFEAHRVLKPGGVLLGTVPHPDGNMGKNHPTGGDFHQTIFETDDLTEVLKYHFPDVQLTPITYSKEYGDFEELEILTPQWNGFVCKKKLEN